MQSLRRVYYGWWILAGAGVGMALIGGLYMWAFGLYIEPLEAEFGWSRAEVSLGISVALLASGLASPFVGRLTDHWGPRLTLLLGTGFASGGFALLATTDALWQWYLYSAVLGVSLAMAFFIPFQVLLSRWFDRRRALALGLLGVGPASLGGLAMVPIVRALIDTVGWEGAFMVSGAVVLAFFLPVSLLLVRNNPPRDATGAHPDAVPGERAAASGAQGLRLGAAMRTPLFWTLTLGISLYFYGAFGLIVHAVPFFEDKGLSSSTAAGIVAAMAGFSFFTRVTVAGLADRVPRFEAIAILLAFTGIAAVSILFAGTATPVILVFILFWALVDTAPPVLESMVLPPAFGVAYFATILGTVGVVRTAFMLVSPTVAGGIFDATGSYDGALIMFIGAFIGAMVFFYISLRLPRPADRMAAAPLPSIG